MGAGGGTATGGGMATGGGGASETDAGASQGLVVNEVGTSGGEFIELFNGTATSIDLSGYKMADLLDADGGVKLMDALVLPSGTTLAANGFLLLTRAGATATETCTSAGAVNCPSFQFGISNSRGDALFLLRPDDTEVTKLVIPPSPAPTGKTYGRFPDGTGAPQVTSRTPGRANAL
jgi:hypothetical protein